MEAEECLLSRVCPFQPGPQKRSWQIPQFPQSLMEDALGAIIQLLERQSRRLSRLQSDI